MSLQVKVGSFVQGSGTGTQAITDVGFTPKGLIFWGNTTGGTHTRIGSSTWRIGLSDGTTNLSYAANSGNLLNSVECAESAFSFTQCFMAVSIEAGPFFTAAIIGYGIVQSMDADGFTINIQHNQGGLCNGNIWNYMAIGGAGVSVKVGKFTYGASGTITVTGLPFEPTALIGYRSSAVDGPVNGSRTSPGLGFAAACNLAQCAFTGAVADVSNPSIDKSFQKNGVFAASISTGAAVTGETTVTAFTSDGFTVDYTGGATLSQHYMAIGGVAANVGVITQPAAIGIQSVDLLAQSPRAVLVAGYCYPSSATPIANQLLSFGAGDLSGQVNAWTGEIDNQPPTFKNDVDIDLTRMITASTPTSNDNSSLNTQASLSTFSALNFDINWTLVDGVAKQWFYLVLADDFGTGPCGAGISNTGAGIYKQVVGNTDDEIYI